MIKIMLRVVVALFALSLFGSALADSTAGFCQGSCTSKYARPQAVCAAWGATWTPVFWGTQDQCGTGYGCCTIPPNNGHYAIVRSTFSCSGDVDYDASIKLQCVTSCTSIGEHETDVFEPDAVTRIGSICLPSQHQYTCANLKLNFDTTGAWECFGTDCPQGTQFLGVGTSTSPQCRGGCSYVAGGETRYTADGVLSRWASSGASCSSGDSLVAADTTGCPNEVGVDLRPLLCGLASPCIAGEFLFMGQCVADTTETGCVVIDGEQLCAEAEQNCVVIDGQRVCAEVPEDEQDLETYRENGCVWSFAQGAWVCPTDTATKTTTGATTTETDPVTGNKTTTTVTTIRNNVTGGTTKVTTTVVTDPDGNEISRDVAEATTGTGGEGGTLAARDPTALGERADLDWLKTEEEVKQIWSDRWEAAPIVAAVSSFSGLSLSSIEGTCPEFCLPLWGETLCTTKHCEIWETVSFIISGVLLALYGMAAMRIILSA